MATEILFSDLKAWLNAQPGNTASTPYEIIIKDAPSGENKGYTNAITRYVRIVDMEMHAGVTSIGEHAFEFCSKLTSITIPSSVTSMGKNVFQSCISLTSVTIPSSVTSISERAFNGCKSLTSITISEGVTSIGTLAFGACTSLTSVTIPESVTYISEYAFQGCTGLTTAAIPDGATYVHFDAFYNCKSLQYIDIYYLPTKSGKTFLCKKIPEDAASFNVRGDCVGISVSAFQNCTSLASVSIPNSVKTIGKQAFQGCTVLSNVYMYPDFSNTLMQSDSFSGTPSTLNLYVPVRKLPGWKSAPLTSYGFASGVVAKMMPSRRWVRVA